MKRILLSCLCVLTFVARGAVTELPELAKAASWESNEIVPVKELGDYLVFELNALEPNKPVRIMLKQPVEAGSGSELFFDGMLSAVYELNLWVLARDAKDNEFIFYPNSRGSVHRKSFIGGTFVGNGLWRIGEATLRCEGMRNARPESWKWVSKVNTKPELPLKVTGFELSTLRKQQKPETNIYLRNFKLSDLNHKSSQYYYQFFNEECFGEVNGKPAVAFSDFGKVAGARFIVDWDVRSEYAGQPFMSGSSEFVPDKKSIYPETLQLSRETVEIPVTQPGLYWVRTKLRWYGKAGAPGVQQIIPRELRLYISSGEAQKLPDAVAGREGMSMIRLAPERNSLVWKEQESWKCNVEFFDAVGAVCRVKVSDFAGVELKKYEFKPENDKAAFELDLSDVKVDACRVTATVLRNNQLQDEVIRDFGRERKPENPEAAFKLPAGVKTAQQIKDGPSLFQFDFMVQFDNTYIQQIKRGMDVTLPITDHFELLGQWGRIEKYPGVYDFSELDALMDYAKEKGAKIQLILGQSAPEWVPSHYTQDPSGAIYGHTSYLFHGARLNLFHSPVLRPACLEFYRRAVLRYRNHPALESYYLLIEHPGEASFRGWFEGFDEFTLADFRGAMQRKYKNIGELNKTWKTDWRDFATLMPKKSGEKGTSQFWLDWIGFREGEISNFRLDVVKLIRHYDPHRLIMLYAHGEEFKPYNVMSANGGCRNPDRFGYSKMVVADLDQGQRAEEVSCSNWYAFYRTHMDTSLFTMMLGGGQNSFCKMFFPIRAVPANGDLTGVRQKNGLERFEMFMPIWSELRDARPVYKDVRLYGSNKEGFQVQRKSTFNPGDSTWDMFGMLESHLSFWNAPGTDWQKAKLVVAFPQRMIYMTGKMMDGLVQYVKDGGVLLMGAEAGRTRIEDDAEWTLLKTFGFSAPGARSAGIPYPIFDVESKEKIGLLRAPYRDYKVGADEKVFAADGGGRPAITVKKFGKGYVYVMWAETNVPFQDRQGKEIKRSYIRDIALKHGAAVPFDANSCFVWANLLQNPKNGTWYLLLMRNLKEHDGTTPPTKVQVTLPEGKYRISELINKKINWTKSAAELREGFEITLAEKEVAILKLEIEK